MQVYITEVLTGSKMNQAHYVLFVISLIIMMDEVFGMFSVGIPVITKNRTYNELIETLLYKCAHRVFSAVI